MQCQQQQHRGLQWLQEVPPVPVEDKVVRVVDTMQELEQAGMRTRSFLRRLQRKEAALVKLEDSNGRSLAFGELHPHMQVFDERKFVDILKIMGLSGHLSSDQTIPEWDAFMRKVQDEIATVVDYVFAPGWRQRFEKKGSRKRVARPEFRQVFDYVELRLIQHLLCAWVRAEMQGAWLFELPWWFCGPRSGWAVGFGLAANRTLLRLDCTGCGIGTTGARAIGRDALPRNDTLVELILDCNDLGDEPARDLAAALKVNQKLEYLALVSNRIMQDGFRSFTRALCQNTTLQVLDLRDNGGVGASRTPASGSEALPGLMLVGMVPLPALWGQFRPQC
eukprot:CAMPEP_0171082132 /NCGR_PEP_ID=MMETSP0766_2-20121228/16914_1 /TAXON_ID=439317 /ORGANISM="Gambierdiscus australes, Strain CAWD 149" /LENGTH=334 /DNA_ID=CAMNT_0011539473 /DNA_START=63 /DNA_END=1065 /DNA_ORIENTATION=-